MTVGWTPSPNARAAPDPGDPSLLASKPLRPLPPATGYHVLEVPREPSTAVDAYGLSLPATLSPQPLAGTALAVPGPVRFGVERCFVVRAVDMIAGAPVVGLASEAGCVTPVDTFPPAPPTAPGCHRRCRCDQPHLGGEQPRPISPAISCCGVPRRVTHCRR